MFDGKSYREVAPRAAAGRGWRRDWDSNPGNAFTLNGFQDRRLQPLGHPSPAGLRTRDYVPSLWLDDLPAVHIRAKGLWDVDRAVGLLVVLENREQGASNREA